MGSTSASVLPVRYSAVFTIPCASKSFAMMALNLCETTPAIAV